MKLRLQFSKPLPKFKLDNLPSLASHPKKTSSTGLPYCHLHSNPRRDSLFLRIIIVPSYRLSKYWHNRISTQIGLTPMLSAI